jgi:nitrite reductase/ring-hydroxylating ferredoxin subunit
MSMEVSNAPITVAKSEDVPEGGRLVVGIDHLEVGIFRLDGALYAYENICQHQGGPVCQGMIIKRVIEVLDEHMQSRGDAFSETDLHVVCPWHG